MREEMIQAAYANQAPPKAADDWGSGLFLFSFSPPFSLFSFSPHSYLSFHSLFLQGGRLGLKCKLHNFNKKQRLSLHCTTMGLSLKMVFFSLLSLSFSSFFLLFLSSHLQTIGPFRSFDDNEENRHFSACLRRGFFFIIPLSISNPFSTPFFLREIPPELQGYGRNIDVNVCLPSSTLSHSPLTTNSPSSSPSSPSSPQMVVHHFDYVPKRSFSSAHTVGAPSPAPAPAPSVETPSVQISEELVIDKNKKVTTIQVIIAILFLFRYRYLYFEFGLSS